MHTKAADDALPLHRRFPALAQLPRAALGTFPTPVERVDVDGRAMLLKRDDHSGSVIGGNKVRGLEFLLGGLSPGDRVLTVGPRGSTHALATARCARHLGADTTVVRWDQVMNAAARTVAAKTRAEARVIDARWVAAAYTIALATRALRRVRWIPAGGAAPLALLGHVNAALELADQLRDLSRLPAGIFVPFGTGGTAAGLALGLRIAGLRIPVWAVRVVPWLLGRRSRLLGLADATARLIERATGEHIPRPEQDDFHVSHDFYGGGYGQPLAGKAVDDAAFGAMRVRLDDTYGRKAFSAAASAHVELPLLWLTFDGRLLQD
jgi:1-aminocyclopropane-1-carboxylate deaminase/D-cysteine desulfhydrase-like pyridoxal-dependent ACC family enzyme